MCIADCIIPDVSQIETMSHDFGDDSNITNITVKYSLERILIDVSIVSEDIEEIDITSKKIGTGIINVWIIFSNKIDIIYLTFFLNTKKLLTCIKNSGTFDNESILEDITIHTERTKTS